MNNPQENNKSNPSPAETKITPLRCFIGGSIAGGIGFASFHLTKAVVFTYANTPITFSNPLAVNIAATVRTLVIGITMLATFVFSLVAVGLTLLGFKLILDSLKGNPSP
ncbi:MAG: DUF3082 domain-containing protein [Geminocystis sp.]|nr:DUF3082 domain-containing protein [Geminocystis sp.]HIK36806.1 DUF3082 domain-containing protein [Geminocystis sp. M7585_C2015_104]MCS7146895.1 DUF3082 domain-containing protein [Geminocystis sp.]MCX8078915.1 DUF3082 domain-containing protein [Geminocystis sp.]MDW8115720.1 DUF3082 domain-containing protein [Geminocystis sp.]